MKLHLRCSSLPLAFLCPGSVRGGEIEIHETHELARLGTACHEGLKTVPQAGSVDWEAVPALARKHECDEGELRHLLAKGERLWRKVHRSFPNAQTEVELSHDFGDFVLTGHADLLGRTLRFAYVGDWKGGRLDSDHSAQVKGYALLVLEADPSVEQVTSGVLWIRDEEWEHYTLRRDRGDGKAFEEAIRERVVRWDGTYEAGSHCAYCPRSHDCPARAAMLKRDVEAFYGQQLTAHTESDELLEQMTADELVSVLERADLVFDHAVRVRDALRSYITRKGDIIGSKKRLTLEQHDRRQVSAMAVFPILTEEYGFEDPDFEKVVDISLRRVEQIIAERAGKGNGAAARRALAARLEAAGAVELHPVTRLVTKRK